MAGPVYLGDNATTPVAPEVFEAMLPRMTERFWNPGSSHVAGRTAAAAVDLADLAIKGYLSANPERRRAAARTPG